MSASFFHWRGHPVPFRPGESIASALAAAGTIFYGPDTLGGDTRYFCGIGACQGCLVAIEGRAVEACLTPASEGLDVWALVDRAIPDSEVSDARA